MVLFSCEDVFITKEKMKEEGQKQIMNLKPYKMNIEIIPMILMMTIMSKMYA